MTVLNVLIVDDSLFAAKNLEAMLTRIGHKVIKIVDSGEAALDAYRECNPDLVTMDVNMAGMDGIQATRSILTEFPGARIIMVTSVGQEILVNEALKAGAKGFVMKPVLPERLTFVLKKVAGT